MENRKQVENIALKEVTVFEAIVLDTKNNEQIKMESQTLDGVLARANVYLIDGRYKPVNVYEVTRQVLSTY